MFCLKNGIRQRLMKPTLLSFKRRISHTKKEIKRRKRNNEYWAFKNGATYTCINSSEEIIAAKEEIHLDKFKISVDHEQIQKFTFAWWNCTWLEFFAHFYYILEYEIEKATNNKDSNPVVLALQVYHTCKDGNKSKLLAFSLTMLCALTKRTEHRANILQN